MNFPAIFLIYHISRLYMYKTKGNLEKPLRNFDIRGQEGISGYLRRLLYNDYGNSAISVIPANLLVDSIFDKCKPLWFSTNVARFIHYNEK